MKEKYCQGCKQTLSIENFAKNRSRKDGFATSCRVCKKKYQNTWYLGHKKEHIRKAGIRRDVKIKENRQYIFDYLTEHPCVDCGERNPIVLEFDHVRGKKTKNISNMHSFSRKTLLVEIEKCDIRCANCHRIKTVKQFGWYQNLRPANIKVM